jgi:Rrf2 family transcriptional regulator, cysteine metabolism repressor
VNRLAITRQAPIRPDEFRHGSGGDRLVLISPVEIVTIPLDRYQYTGDRTKMSVSSKCYYALRAVYALAEHQGPEPMKIAEIAQLEQIPIRFLEVILSQLKGGGFVQSRRGADGGYLLARPADQLTVGEVMRYVDGPIAPVDCVSQSRPKVCEFPGGCNFFSFWGRVRQAISDVVDKTTFADLIRESHERGSTHVGDWII